MRTRVTLGVQLKMCCDASQLLQRGVMMAGWMGRCAETEGAGEMETLVADGLCRERETQG